MSRTIRLLLAIALAGVVLVPTASARTGSVEVGFVRTHTVPLRVPAPGGAPVSAAQAQPSVSIAEDKPDDAASWGFRPPEVVVQAGGAVVWRNTGRNVHTVTSDDGVFDSGNLAPGATWKHRFDTPGVFAYHCTPHPWMKGTVRVTRP